MRLKMKTIEKIKGFLDPDEGQHLFEIAIQASKMGPCLEIGSYCGKSAIYIGAACKENDGILYSIDHHHGSEEQQPGEEYFDPELFSPFSFQLDTFPLFRKAIFEAGLSDQVVPIVSRSATVAKAWATPLSMIFIDGGHAYETALSDYTSWSPHLMPNGFLVIHDIFPNPDDGGQAPYQIYQKALSSQNYEKHSLIKTLGVLKKKPKNSTF